MAKRLEELSKKDLLKKFGSALADRYDTNIGAYSRNNNKEDVIQDIEGLGLNQGDDFLERKSGGTVKKMNMGGVMKNRGGTFKGTF